AALELQWYVPEASPRRLSRVRVPCHRVTTMAKKTSAKPSVKKKAAKKAAKKPAVKKKAAKPATAEESLGRPKVTADEKLYWLFHDNFEARSVFEFLRVETVRELEE